jgi:DNA-binding MarR family transcriptional regulator
MSPDYDARVVLHNYQGRSSVDDAHDVLDLTMAWLFRLRGVLDPAQAVPGLGASMSEALALGQLTSGELSQQDLADRLGLEKSTVSRLMEGMAAKGWVERDRDPANRRYRRVGLTPDGRTAARRVADAIRERHQRVLASLTPDERAAVAVALPALARAMAAEFDHQPHR